MSSKAAAAMYPGLAAKEVEQRRVTDREGQPDWSGQPTRCGRSPDRYQMRMTEFRVYGE
jgi:hypothetical protein